MINLAGATMVRMLIGYIQPFLRILYRITGLNIYSVTLVSAPTHFAEADTISKEKTFEWGQFSHNIYYDVIT
jgi:hypothetical protein